MKKIAVFQQDLGVGGIQKSLFNLLNNLDYSKLRVDLYLFEENTFWEGSFPEGVNVIKMKKPPRIFSFLPFELGKKLYSFKFKCAEEYDAAIDFNSYQFACALGAVTVPAKRRIMWIHNDVEIKLNDEWKYRVLWNAFKGKFKYYDEFVPVSKALTEPFIKMSGMKDKKFTSIQNLIDVDDIRRKQNTPEGIPEIDESCMNFVAVGKLCHQKAYDLMLPMFAEASEKRDDLRLYVLGDGPDKQQLTELRDQLGLQNKVHFLGNRPNPFCVMDKMDAFISTSRYEGQPLNIMEAKAVGLPLYCSKNLEKYIQGLEGCEDMVSALVSAKKQPKIPDGLETYNSEIINAVVKLAEDDNHRRRIAVFQQDLGVGGIQKSLINLLKGFDYSNTDIDVYLFEKTDFWDVKFPENVTVRYLKPAARIFSFIPFDIGKALNSFHFDAGKKYDLAMDYNSYQFSCALAALTVPARHRVMWIHNDVEIKLKNEWKYRVLFNAFKGKLKYFDGFVGVSAALIEPFKRVTGLEDKSYVSIQNYIDVDEIHSKQNEDIDLEIDRSFTNFVAVGRLCHQKGYDIMLDCFAKAAEARKDLRLYIVGGGEDERKLVEKCNSLGLADSVFFLGSRANPYSIMNRMDAFVSTSRYEGQGMNIMEAAVLGLPIIYPEHLEKYVNSFRKGSTDVAESIAAFEKTAKQPDNLESYNAEIIKNIIDLCEM